MGLRRWLSWRTDRELAEEIQAHIDLAAREGIERGLSPEQALLQAQRTFGNATRVAERVREASPLHWVETGARDVRHALRLLGRSPVFTLVAIATLTLGIGMNVSMVTYIYTLLLRPRVDSSPETFVKPYMFDVTGQQRRIMPVSVNTYQAFRDGAKSLESLAAWTQGDFTLGGDDPAPVRGLLVSCNFFRTYGPVNAALGRLLREDDCSTPGGGAVVVLSNRLWLLQFAADPDIIGKTITINRNALTVVGVAPTPFAGQVNSARFWAPYTIHPLLRGPGDLFRRPDQGWLELAGRLKPGLTRTQVQADLAVIAEQQDRLTPGRKTSIEVADGSWFGHPESRRAGFIPLTLVMFALTLLLAITCANVMTLLLARAAARQREMAVRLSLGASRWRLLRQLLTETMVLTGAAAMASLYLAFRVPRILERFLLNEPLELPMDPDFKVFAYIAGVAFGAALLAGLAPAIESLRQDVSTALKSGGQASASGFRRSRMHGALIGTQVALSLVLLAGAALFLRAHYRLQHESLGFDPNRIVITPMRLQAMGYTAQTAPAFYRSVIEKVSALRGVESVAYALFTAAERWPSAPVKRMGGGPGDEMRPANVNFVSPGYFRTLGVAVLRGRDFMDTELTARPGIATPVIVSQSLATAFWPGGDPIGKQLEIQGRPYEVIGVAGNVRSLIPSDQSDLVGYAPMNLMNTGGSQLVLRHSGDARPLMQALRTVVREVDSALIVRPVILTAFVERQISRYASVWAPIAVTGAVALMLAVMGIYGVVGFTVNRRTQEIGVRMALGAQRGDVIRLIMKAGARPIVLGVVAGFVLAAPAAQLLRRTPFLFGMSAFDPIAYGAVAALLLVVGLAATFVPARRASRLDPLSALRQE